MPVAMLLPMLTSLGRALAGQFIDNEEYLKWIAVAFNVFDSASDLENRLTKLNDRLGERLDAGEHFQEADFDAILTEIAGRDQAWADL